MPTPTPPADPTPTHEARDVAEGFGAEAERYDRARPRYPQAMVERLVAASPGRAVLDVGTGTGIAAAAFREAGCDVTALDPDARMAALARRRGVDVEIASLEAWDAGERSFDLVVAGQCWHWIDPVAGGAKVAAVLRPGGRVAMCWNAAVVPEDLRARFAATYRRVVPELPMDAWSIWGRDVYGALADAALDDLRAAGPFGGFERWRFDREEPCTRDGFLDFAQTVGGHAPLDHATMGTLLGALGDDVDAVGGSFPMGYTTFVATAVRVAG